MPLELCPFFRNDVVKILIADDDSISRAMICVPLRTSADLEIVEAANGQQARALFDKYQFDAVVVDWQMPGMTGLDFTRSIRLAGSNVPILMVTAQSDRQHVVKAIKAGISDYLLKPFDATVLWSKVSRLIGRPVETRPVETK
jgi:two-component system chemotaxis response regulator CheY